MKDLLLGVVGALPKESEDSRYGVSVWKNLYKRSLLCGEKIEFLSEREMMSEDTFFNVDFVKHAKRAVGIHGAFYYYRRNDESFSKAYRVDRLEKAAAFLTALEARLADHLAKGEYGLYLDRLAQGYGRIICAQEVMHARDNQIQYSALRGRLKRICTHDKIAEALRSYPWYQLPKKQAAFACAMKYKLYFLQKLMVLLRAR